MLEQSGNPFAGAIGVDQALLYRGDRAAVPSLVDIGDCSDAEDKLSELAALRRGFGHGCNATLDLIQQPILAGLAEQPVLHGQQPNRFPRV